MRQWSIGLVALTWAGTAAAELRPAPDYFVDVTFATTTAQALAQACPTLSFALLAASRASNTVMQQLEADGFNLDMLFDEMLDPTLQFETRRARFLERHDLTDRASPEAACRAGETELDEGTGIGAYLVRVPA